MAGITFGRKKEDRGKEKKLVRKDKIDKVKITEKEINIRKKIK